MSEQQRFRSSWKCSTTGMIVTILLRVALIIFAPLLKSPPKKESC